ncbi:general substrate transporter [Fistulina hepatica ATCC 64428]|uniref:General substrate transporter n=1 Tax=Fistulina hepatica ATCC 64428 TaxID=1128425 RepID=A0A0D7APB6_9AGAR|nr:general substrate transporter [Fistulina hepatica ATCC 64428]
MSVDTGTRLGAFRAYYLGLVVCIGGFLFGYDSGIVGSVLTLSSFEKDFRYSSGEATRVDSLAVGIQQAGALVGCFIVWPINRLWGRRGALMICSLVFCIGVILETINTHSLAAFYVGRVVAGLGLGGSSVVITMFNAEMSPKHLRGRIGSFYQWMYTFGIFLSYWVDYGVEEHVASTAKQWQIPIGLQLVPGALLGIGMLTLRESVRWLEKTGRHEEAWENLKWIRADDSQVVRDEMEEIKANIDEERRATAGFRIHELLEKDNMRRLAFAFGIFTAQQSVGASALANAYLQLTRFLQAYYSPEFFKLLVGGGSKDVLLSGIFGAVKIVACGTFVLFFSERLRRKSALIGGALVMAACMIPTAAVVAARPPPASGDVTSSGIATVALIYLNIMAYNFSWGPLPWPLVSEVFPPRIRDIGVGVGVGAQWLFSFVYTFSASYMIANMGWGTFLLFGVFDLIIALLSFLFIKETKGFSLEEVQELYTSGSVSSTTGKDAESILKAQMSMVKTN